QGGLRTQLAAAGRAVAATLAADRTRTRRRQRVRGARTAIVQRTARGGQGAHVPATLRGDAHDSAGRGCRGEPDAHSGRLAASGAGAATHARRRTEVGRWTVNWPGRRRL